MNLPEVKLDAIIGPFEGKVYCNYFFIIMVLSILVLLGTLVSLVMDVFQNKAKSTMVLAFVLLNNFLLYFNVRLVYSMCLNSMA